VPVLFFEAATGRRQIGGVHQRDGVRLHALPTQQPFQQVLIDLPQALDADLLPKLVQHPHAGPVPTQATEALPSGLFGQLSDHQIERVRRGQQRQQMHAPQLGGTQRAGPPAGAMTRAQLVDEPVGHIRRQQLQQAMGPSGWKNRSHARTLTERRPLANPPAWAKVNSRQLLTEPFGTPSERACSESPLLFLRFAEES